jgi:hypothetical protein
VRRVLLAVGVAALLVTAGCGGTSGPAATATTESATTAATTTQASTETTQTTVGPPEYPVGVSADAVENASALVNAHRSHVAEHGAVLRGTTDTNGSLNNRTIAVTATEMARLSPNATHLQWTLDGTRTVNGTAEPTLDESYWANESVLVSRVTADGNSTVRVRNRTGIYDDVVVNAAAKDRIVEAALTNANYTVAGTEYRDGRWLTTLVSVNGTYSGQQPVTEFDATLVVAASGRLVSMERTWTSETERSRTRYHDEFAWSPAEPVERSDWVPANASAS